MTAQNITLPSEAHLAPAARPVRVSGAHRLHIWDLPLRIFHWSLTLSVSTAIATGLAGGDWMRWHSRAGIAIIGLVSFRLAWGFLGSTHSRFSHFWPTPRKVLAYLKGQWQGTGHNPLGALSVFALLLALVFQASTGLYGNDDIAFIGPLAASVSDDLSHQLTNLHRQFATAIYALLALHLSAIAYYVHIKKRNLVRPMITGWQPSPEPVESAHRRSPLSAFLVAVVIASASTYTAAGFWQQNPLTTEKDAHDAGAAPSQQTPSW